MLLILNFNVLIYMIYIENLSTRDMDSVTWNDLIIELILLETMEG